MTTTMTFDTLQKLVTGDAVAIRVRQRLQPAGGPGDKVFPPTFATNDKTLKYAMEMRRIDGREVACCLLDSVASQANRMEEALLAAWEAQKITFPVIGVAFDDPALADIGTVTTLQAPHRIADAILRDATDESGRTLFRNLPEGRAYTEATPKNATAVLALCPTALVFGVWDSTGPKGGSGSKFQRAMTSEIVAIGAVPGSKVGSRIDPLGIEAKVDLFHRADDESDWTINEAEAKKEKGRPVPFSRSGGDGKNKGKASSVNHSNIAPTIDTFAGGITFDYAVQTVLLSLPALRRLRCATGLDGKALGDKRVAVEEAGRVALAALALAGIVHQRARGYDLRSRCALVPEGGLVLEIVKADGTVEQASLSLDEANALVEAARKALESSGLAWQREPLKLKAAPKLVALVKRSRELAAAGAGGEENA
jgi:CRISPR-associated protein Csb1